MKSALQTICLIVIMFVHPLSTARGKDAPSSAEQLRSQVEAALRAKDTNTFKSLFNWQGVSDSMKADMNEENADLFGHEIASVKLSPLSADVQLTNELNGVRYKPNVTVVGRVVVQYSEQGNSVELPYGTEDNRFYLSATIGETVAAPATKEKSLNISVMGSATADAAGFSGSYVYVKGGKEITANIDGKGNRSEAFWGDYIKSCTVKKNSVKGWIRVVISEDGKPVFRSEMVSTDVPILYKKE